MLAPEDDNIFDSAWFVIEFIRLLVEGRFRQVQSGSNICETYITAPREKSPFKRGLNVDDTKAFCTVLKDLGFEEVNIGLVDVVMRIPFFRKPKNVYKIMFRLTEKGQTNIQKQRRQQNVA